jgi:integrase
MSKGLTAIAVDNLKPRPKRYEVPDDGQRGLLVAVFPSGKKSFVVRYRFNGVKRKLTLGGISLAAARKKAADALFEVHEGRDPIEADKTRKAKTADAATNTVKSICEDYLKREGVKLRTHDNRKAAFERLVYPVIGRVPIYSLKRSQIVKLMDQIEDHNGSRMADLTLSYLGKVFNWHASRSDDFRSPLVKGMTRHKSTKLDKILSDKENGDPELKAVWKAATEGQGPFPALVKFLLLTAARRTEAAAMTWDEISPSGDWTLLAARNKTNVDLIRPLSTAALAVVDAQRREDGGPYVFSTDDGETPISGFSKFKEKFDEACCGVSGWTLHDLRRTAKTLMRRAGVSPADSEQCLGHVIKGVEGVYDKHDYYDEKKRAYDALATLIERIVDPADNVVPMRRGAEADV